MTVSDMSTTQPVPSGETHSETEGQGAVSTIQNSGLTAERAALDGLRKRRQRLDSERAERSPGPAKAGGGSDALMRRVLSYLTGPTGGKRIPEIDVAEDRLGQLVRFLQQRAQTRDGNPANAPARALRFLCQNTGGPMVHGVNLNNLRIFLQRARTRLGNDSREQALATTTAAVKARGQPGMVGAVGGQSLEELIETSRRLAEQIEQMKLQLDQQRALTTRPSGDTESSR